MNAILNHDSRGCCRTDAFFAPQLRRTEKPRSESFSAALGSLNVIQRGYGGHPMVTLCVQRARDTRAPSIAVVAPNSPISVSRFGRRLQIPCFAGNAVMRPRFRSRPVKRLFAGLRALFFIARNEGSSMTTVNNPYIHRMK